VPDFYDWPQGLVPGGCLCSRRPAGKFFLVVSIRRRARLSFVKRVNKTALLDLPHQRRVYN
jgi:hypothetical protein